MFDREWEEKTVKRLEEFSKEKAQNSSQAETEVENVFGVGSIMEPLEEVNFQKESWDRAKVIFHEALREMGYFGNVSELEAFNFQMRDKHGDNSVEIFGVDDGEFHIKLHSGRFTSGVRKPEPILIRGGER